MSETNDDPSKNLCFAAAYTGCLGLETCALIRQFYSQSVDLDELEGHENALISNVDRALKKLKIKRADAKFQKNIRDELGRLDAKWLESEISALARNHPRFNELANPKRIRSEDSDRLLIGWPRQLADWLQIAPLEIRKVKMDIAHMVRDQCVMPDSEDLRRPKRLIGLLQSYWDLLSQVLNSTANELLSTSLETHIVSMLINLRRRMNEIIKLLPETEEVASIRKTLDELWAPLFQEGGSDLDDLRYDRAFLQARVGRIEHLLEQTRLIVGGQIRPEKTFAEALFLDAVGEEVSRYRDEKAAENSTLQGHPKLLQSHRKEFEAKYRDRASQRRSATGVVSESVENDQVSPSKNTTTGEIRGTKEALSPEPSTIVDENNKIPLNRPKPLFIFRPDGNGYYLEGFGESGHFKSLKGMADLFRLVQSPGEGVLLLELDAGPGMTRAAGDGHSKQYVYDQKAFEQIKTAWNQLKTDIEGAESEIERDELAKKLKQLEAEFFKDGRAGGRSRDLNDANNKLRPKIAGRITTACEAMTNAVKPCPELAKHFMDACRAEGAFYKYSPGITGMKWDT